MSLVLDLSVRVGSLDLAVALEAPAGAVTAVLGPNGAGKSTLMRCVAGSLAVDAGGVWLDDVPLDRPPDVFVPQERRGVGVVLQDHVLFPHLTVLENVAFGPRSRGRRARDARRVAREWLERVGVADRAADKPRTLSGGEAQRVALARALAIEPAALLLDEPLAALDAGTRLQVRRDLRRFLVDYAGATVLVTHDPVDALALADHVVVLEHGRVTQAGDLHEVTSRPRSRYVADLIGTNLLHGVADGTRIVTSGGVTLVSAEPHRGRVLVTVPPAAVALHRREPEGSPRNRWPATVAHLDLLGDRVWVRLAPPVDLVAEITPGAAEDLDVREGRSLWASVKATEVTAYPE